MNAKDLYTMETFKKYKNDWNYPIGVKNLYIPRESSFKGKCVTFQEALKVPLVTGQCFGLNPVLGICEKDANKLRFTVRSWRFLFTVLSLLGQCSSVLLCFIKMLKETDSSLRSNTSIIFHLTTCTTTIIFLRIATQWPLLCVQIAKTETADPNTDISLTKWCNMSCVIILALASFEHVLSDVAGIAFAVDCGPPDQSAYQTFIVGSFPWIFAFIPYNHFVGVYSQFINFQCAFNWNFADLFVICMSLYLTSRLEQVNQRIRAVREKDVPMSFWKTMREDYNRATWLVRQVDDIIGGVVFISFANNLFFICLQLLHTLAPFRGYEQTAYVVYSFSFLMVRSLAVSLAASRVHTASKAPATTLYGVSSSIYSVERIPLNIIWVIGLFRHLLIQRFLDQIHGDSVSLSGLQFFNVKRGMILSVAGTIVTYELVLMQFTGVSPTSAPAT